MKVREPQRPTPPEVEPGAIAPSPEACVDCPLCQGSFPVARIEWHAAYCDGEVAVLEEREPGGGESVRESNRSLITSHIKLYIGQLLFCFPSDVLSVFNVSGGFTSSLVRKPLLVLFTLCRWFKVSFSTLVSSKPRRKRRRAELPEAEESQESVSR